MEWTGISQAYMWLHRTKAPVQNVIDLSTAKASEVFFLMFSLSSEEMVCLLSICAVCGHVPSSVAV